jgi:beta-N-acetylhexosaminidase
VAAGTDLCCLGSEGTDELIGACIDALVAAVGHGDLTEARLAEAAGRVGTISRRWLHAPRSVTSSLIDLGAEAARRALVVDGDLAEPLGPAHVVELRATPNIAAGVVPWGVAAPLTDLAPDTTSEQIDPAAVAAMIPVLERAQGRRLVVVARDAQRRAATTEVVQTLVRARPDAIVVDMGWPSGSQVAAGPAGVHVSTYGASRASGEAVARLLTGRGAPASPTAAASTTPTTPTAATAGGSGHG